MHPPHPWGSSGLTAQFPDETPEGVSSSHTLETLSEPEIHVFLCYLPTTDRLIKQITQKEQDGVLTS